MKKNNILLEIAIILLIILVIWLRIDYSGLDYRQTELIKTVNSLKADIVDIKKQLQTIQDNYVSYDDLQPTIDLFDDYQLEVDCIRNNLNDYNGLFENMFGYKVKKYQMRGD